MEITEQEAAEASVVTLQGRPLPSDMCSQAFERAVIDALDLTEQSGLDHETCFEGFPRLVLR